MFVFDKRRLESLGDRKDDLDLVGGVAWAEDVVHLKTACRAFLHFGHVMVSGIVGLSLLNRHSVFLMQQTVALSPDQSKLSEREEVVLGLIAGLVEELHGHRE